MTSDPSTTCRACGDDGKPATTRWKDMGRFRFRICSRCGYHQLEPAPSLAELQQIYGAAYFDKGKYAADLAEQREQERRVGLLRRAGLKDGAKVLDFGCATGVFIRHAASLFDMWGAEISEQALAGARRDLPEHADRLLDLSGLAGLESESFDAVVAWDVVEHLVDPAKMLKHLSRLVRPGGLIALSTPDIKAPTAKALGRRWAFMTPPEHVGFFSAASLAHLLRKSGFTPGRATSRGKWVNLGFLLYKIGRVAPELVSPSLVARVRASRLGRMCLYVPSGDILYMTARKRTT
jgi:SAM-dependent methyltransferase